MNLVSLTYLNALFSMSAYYKETNSTTTHGQWSNAKIPLNMQSLRSTSVNDKYRTWIETWGESRNDRITEEDEIPVIPTLQPIVAARPSQSIIVKLKGERDEKKFNSVIKAIDAEHFILFNRDADWSCFSLQFIFPFHFWCFFRKAKDLIAPVDPLWRYRNWKMMSIPLCITKKRGCNIANVPESDPTYLDAIEGDKDRIIFNPDIDMNALLKTVISDHNTKWTQENYRHLVEMQDGGCANLESALCEPKESDFDLFELLPDHRDWLRFWDLHDIENHNRKRARELNKQNLRDSERMAVIQMQVNQITTRLNTQARINLNDSNNMGRNAKPSSMRDSSIDNPQSQSCHQHKPSPTFEEAEERQKISPKKVTDSEPLETPRGAREINSSQNAFNRQYRLKHLQRLRKKGHDINTESFMDLPSYSILDKDISVDNIDPNSAVFESTRIHDEPAEKGRNFIDEIENRGDLSRSMLKTSIEKMKNLTDSIGKKGTPKRKLSENEENQVNKTKKEKLESKEDKPKESSEAADCEVKTEDKPEDKPEEKSEEKKSDRKGRNRVLCDNRIRINSILTNFNELTDNELNLHKTLKAKTRNRSTKRRSTYSQIEKTVKRTQLHIIKERDKRIEKKRSWKILAESMNLSHLDKLSTKLETFKLHDGSFTMKIQLGPLIFLLTNKKSITFNTKIASCLAKRISESGVKFECLVRKKKVKISESIDCKITYEGDLNRWTRKKFCEIIDLKTSLSHIRTSIGRTLREEKIEQFDNWADNLMKLKKGMSIPIENEANAYINDENVFELEKLKNEAGLDLLPVLETEEQAAKKAAMSLYKKSVELSCMKDNDKNFRLSDFQEVRINDFLHNDSSYTSNPDMFHETEYLNEIELHKSFTSSSPFMKDSSNILTSQTCHQQNQIPTCVTNIDVTDLSDVENPRESTNFYHHWLDGQGYNIQRQKEPDYMFHSNSRMIGKKENDLKIMYLNLPCQKMTGHKNLFELCTIEFPYIDIFMISEMLWVPEQHCSTCPDGYDIITHDKLNLKYSAIMYKKIDELVVKQRPSKLIETSATFQLGKNDIFGLTTVYRSPTPGSLMYTKLDLGSGPGNTITKYVRGLGEIFGEYMKNDNLEIYAGDINIEVNGSRSGRHEREGREIWGDLDKNIAINLLKNQVTFPRGGTNLDILFLNRPDKCKGITRICPIRYSDISDHNIFYISLKTRLNIKNNEIRSKVKIKNNDEDLTKLANLNEMQNLMNSTWRDTRNVESTIESISKNSKKLFPLKTFVPKPNTKLLENDPAVKALVDERSRYIEVMQYDGIGSRVWVNDEYLKNMNRSISREKVKAKKRLIKKKLEKVNNAKSCWDILKIMKKRADGFPEFVNPSSAAKAFRDLSWNYKPKNEQLLEPINEEEDDEDEDEDEDEEEIDTPEEREGVRQYRPSNRKFKIPTLNVRSQNYYENPKCMLLDGKGAEFSYGPDEITLNQIKRFDDLSWNTLNDIFNTIFEAGRYPRSFRSQRMVPVKKKHIISTLKDIRPVTVSNNMANLVEKIITKLLYHHSETNGWLHDLQHGFRSGHSIGQLLSKMRKTFSRSSLKKKCIVLTDLSNAFGSPDVELILNFLRSRMPKESLDLMKSFLSQSAVYVEIDGKKSAIFHTAGRGFAQGSTLSPLMFCIIMCGTHLDVENIGFSFADDCQFLCDASNDEQLKNEILKTITEFDAFCEKWNIKLNVAKTWYIYNKDLKIKYKNVHVKNKLESKVLGFQLLHDMSIEPQIKWIKNSMGSIGHITKRMKNYIDLRGLGIMLSGFLYGRFNHGSAHTERWSKRDYNNLQSKENYFLKIKAHNEMLKKYNENDESINPIRRHIQVYLNKLGTDNPIKFIPFPQWFLLEKSGLLTFENNHILLKLKKLGKVALTARPTSEFRDLVRHMINARTFSRRATGNYNYFTPILSADRRLTGKNFKLVKSTAPQIWIEEFELLEQRLKNQIGNKSFILAVEHKIKELCQHNNSDRTVCQNCGTITGNDRIEEEIIERFNEEIRNSVVILREENMELERIPTNELRMTDIVVEFQYSEAFRDEMNDNQSIRRRLGL